MNTTMTLQAVLDHKAKVPAKKMNHHLFLVRLSFGCWEGKVQDKDAARKREQDAHAIAGSATAGKKVAAGVAEHKALTDYCAMVRNKWTKVTVEWDAGRGGARGRAPETMPELFMEVAELEKGYWAVVEEFLAVWPTVLTNRQYDLGALFNPKDFPSPKAMEHKFYWTFDPSVMADPNDIRFAEGVDADVAEQLIDVAVSNVEKKYKAAANDAAAKLFKVVQAMSEKLATPIGEKGSIFRDSMIENILGVCELLPALNVTNDPALANMARAAKKLATKSPVDLREDEVKREAAAKEASKLARSIADAFDVEVNDD